MITLFVRHEVKDYKAWKAAYDSYDRKGDGCTRATVSRDPEKPNLVVVTETFSDLATAKKHATSDNLKAAMHEAGVVGSPEWWFGEEVEDVSY